MITPDVLDLVYHCMLAALVGHELDAVKRHEWRLIPLLRRLPERAAEQTFIWLHVPIFALIFLGGVGEISNEVRLALSSFAVIHVGLHWLFRKHPANEFGNPGSWALILSTGILGACYLALAARW